MALLTSKNLFMKRRFTLLFSLLFLAASAGYAYQNRLTISSVNNQTLRVQIDGRFYQLTGQDNGIQLQGLRPGIKTIKVYRAASTYPTRQGNNDRNMQLLYNGHLNIRQGYHVDVTINRFGKAFVDEQQLGRNNRDDDWDLPSSSNGWNTAMSDRSFMQLKQAVARESFDENRMSIAKAALRSQKIASYQAKDLLNTFSFETAKLEMAKFCFALATDPSNYYVVAEALSYSNSRNELMRYIQQYR
ncbi:MAG: DUF4476 domain-containing protein [Chitinophagaceae bacterium]|nr:MAG: DUF4476 domain-containing protein [Chitinophagaceae bacterium]